MDEKYKRMMWEICTFLLSISVEQSYNCQHEHQCLLANRVQEDKEKYTIAIVHSF